MHELMAQLAFGLDPLRPDMTKGSRMPPPWVFCL